MPSSNWQTVSLIGFARRESARNPLIAVPDRAGFQLSAHKSQVLLTSCLARLLDRGVDAERLVRGPLAAAIRDGLITTAAVAYSDLSTGDREVPFKQRFLGERLRSSIGDAPPVIKTDSGLLFSHALRKAPGTEFAAKIDGWIASATPQAIALWMFPYDVSQWDVLPEADPPASDIEMAWLVERLSQTYFEDWTTDSLHFELRWSQGTVETSIPPHVLSERFVDLDRLTAEIARRATLLNGEDLRYGLEIEGLVERAVELLIADRSELAAALFEAAMVRAPAKHHGRLRSHRGFCLVPSSPKTALDIINSVVDGDDDQAIRLYNLAVAHVACGDSASAIDAARKAAAAADCTEAYLWHPDPQMMPRLVRGNARELASELLGALGAS
ncbi:MAG: hypothetical protein Q7V57_00905 [Actinomycetota bacterium]|nr:hypothetical protein [Actinomycetota bacterium]